MKIEELKSLARLARLECTEEELRTFESQINEILSYAAQLNQVDTADTAPLNHPHLLSNVFRGDEITGSLLLEQVSRMAPASSGGLIKVPKIIE